MDADKFQDACELIDKTVRAKKGIGTLGEKTMHAVLKQYFSSDENAQEQKFGGFVADIMDERGIIEIQTRSFDKLRKKLDFFLKDKSVTVVFPVAKTKWIYWINQETGEISSKRKSPRKGSSCDILFEMYRIKSYLKHPHLRFCIILVNVAEFRNLNGWSLDKKKGASRFDRIPIELVDEVYINNCADYKKLIPEQLKEPFTSKQYKTALGMSLNRAQTALHVLHYVGAVKRVGKVGNAYLYEKV